VIVTRQRQLSQNHVPISTPSRPMLDNFLAGKIEHLTQEIIIGEAGLILGDLLELGVQPLNILVVYMISSISGGYT